MGQSLAEQITSQCKLPWHRWHCVQSLPNRTSRSDTFLKVFAYNSPMRGRSFSHTAPSNSSLPTSGFLQAIHVCVFFANFINPPSVGAATEIDRVCSPVNNCAAFFSPRIGSKIRPSGLESWLSSSWIQYRPSQWHRLHGHQESAQNLRHVSSFVEQAQRELAWKSSLL